VLGGEKDILVSENANYFEKLDMTNVITIL
jgi:hypothetical protein